MVFYPANDGTPIQPTNPQPEELMKYVEKNAAIKFKLPLYPHLTDSEFEKLESVKDL